MEYSDNPTLRASHRRVRLIALAVGLGMLCYAVVAEALWWLEVELPALPRLLELGRPLVAVLAFALFFAIGALRRRMLGEGGELGQMVGQALLPQERYRKMEQAALISFLLCELVALLGLGLVFVGGGRPDLYLPVGLGLLYLWHYLPRYAQWQGWYARRNRIR